MKIHTYYQPVRKHGKPFVLVQVALAFLVSGSIPLAAAAKDKSDQLTLVEMGKIRAEKELVSAPRVALKNELQWFGFELLVSAPEGDYHSVGSLQRAIMPMDGIWDSTEIWTAGGQVVRLKFIKKQASPAEDSAFRRALSKLVDERLQVSSHLSLYSSDYVWEVATETEFLQKWSTHTTCMVAFIKGGVDYSGALGACGEAPRKMSLVTHLSSVVLEQSDRAKTYSLTVTTKETASYLKGKRENLESDMREKLERY